MASGRSGGSWFLMLFGLPFLAAGTGVLIFAANRWQAHSAAQSWPAVPATITKADIEEHDDSDGDSTYNVAAAYSYEYEGRTHTGSRVDIMGGSSSNYSKHRQRRDELAAHMEKGTPVRAYVNPDDPTQAVLYREADPWMWAMIPFGLVFVGAGVAVSAMGIAAFRRKRLMEKIEETDSGHYWHAREDWRGGRVEASAVKELLVRWAVGGGLTLFVSIFVIVMAGEGAPFFAWAVIGLFALFAVFSFISAVLATARQVVHGTPVLYLGEVPLVPGRRVPAVVQTARPLRAERWTVRLECNVPMRDSDSSDHHEVDALLEQLDHLPGGRRHLMVSNTRGMCAYRLEMPPAGETGRSRTGAALLPVMIEVPEGAPVTSLDPNLSVNWTLVVKAKVVPVSLSATFDLPVFRADEGEIETKSLGL